MQQDEQPEFYVQRFARGSGLHEFPINGILPELGDQHAHIGYPSNRKRRLPYMERPAPKAARAKTIDAFLVTKNYLNIRIGEAV